MKLGKHAVKVIVIFLALFLVGIGLKFVGLHEGFQERIRKPSRKTPSRKTSSRKLRTN